MNYTGIPWDRVTDAQFEEICLYIAQIENPSLNLDLYLKKGNKQHGIDIKAFNLVDGKNLCIQCKNYNVIKLSGLKKTIAEFKNGEFFRKTSVFIIATRANLQKKELKDYLDKETQEFKSVNILLDYWDKGNLGKKLKGYYRLVEGYFGSGVADEHCFGKGVQRTNYNAVENYLERKVLKIEGDKKSDDFRYYFAIKDSLSIKNIFFEDFLSTKRIAIVADANQGKTTVLAQLAYDLQSRYVPILVQVKKYSIDAIDVILNRSFPFWKEYPSKELVVVLDGLDEVPKNQFLVYTKYINEFCKAYSSINVIFSCRKLFYNHYSVYNEVDAFDFYELFPIQEDQINLYIQVQLSSKKIEFEKYVAAHSLESFLRDPFYLTLLVQNYKKSRTNLPKNKKDILSYIITESFNPSRDRTLSDGSKLVHEEVKYKNLVKKFALANQILGLNILDSFTVQSLFNPEEREILTHSSVLTISNNNWTFNNAFFQESFAALALTDLPLEILVDIITVGSKRKKLKTKWIQTVASYISLLDENNNHREAVLSIIENDNIELLVLCDPSKFSKEFRLGVIKKIIDRCVERSTYPLIIREKGIADFIKDYKDGLNHCLLIINSDVPLFIKTLACRIIYNYDELYFLDVKVANVLVQEILRVDGHSYLAALIQVLIKHKLASGELIDSLTKTEKLFSSYEVFNCLLELIMGYELVDEYYSVGLRGIRIHNNYRESYLPLYTERILQRFLFKTTNPQNIYALLRTAVDSEWKLLFETNYTIENKNEILKMLCDRCVSVFAINPNMVLPIIQLVKKQLLRYHGDGSVILYDFFVETKNVLLLLKMSMDDFLSHQLWAVPFIINEDCFDYIFYEYEENRLDENNLRDIYFGIGYWKNNKKELATKFHEKLVAAAAIDFITIQQEKNREYWDLEKKKNENDIKFIQTQNAFVKGLKSFFKAYGRGSIPKNELFVGYSNNIIRRKNDSRFISDFFLNLGIKQKELSLDEALKIVNNVEWFEHFRAKEILRYNFPNDESKSKLLPILRTYYIEGMRTANFPNSIIQNGNNYKISGKESLLQEIFTKFRFDTPTEFLVQLLWQVWDGFNHLKTVPYSNSKQDSLSNLIIERVERDVLASAVINNIKSGINVDRVLSSHLELCRHLKIKEVTELIIQQNIFDRFSSYEQSYVLGIYQELEGDNSKLLSIFYSIDDPNHPLYLDLVKVLKLDYSKEISASLLQVVKDVEASKETKIEATYCLMDMGVKEGFSYFINIIIEQGIFEGIHGAPTLDNIDTGFALTKISSLSQHILDVNQSVHSNHMRSPSLKDIILDILYRLAKESESDLLLVEEFLYNLYEESKNIHENAKDILYHIDRIVERFREVDGNTYEIGALRKVVNYIAN